MAYNGILNNEFNIKLIVLFVLKHYGKPVTNQVLTQMALEDVDIDYYLFQKCLFDVIKIGWIRTFKEDGEYKYELCEDSYESVECFQNKIPYMIRQKILFCIKKQLTAELPKTAVESDIIVSENGEFNVYLRIFEKGDLLFELNVNVGSRELALRTKEHFLKNATEIYMETTKNVMKDV